MNTLQGIVWGTKYVRFTMINISKYEQFTCKTGAYNNKPICEITRIYSHFVCPFWFPAFSDVLILFAVTAIPAIGQSDELIVCFFWRRELGKPVH